MSSESSHGGTSPGREEASGAGSSEPDETPVAEAGGLPVTVPVAEPIPAAGEINEINIVRDVSEAGVTVAAQKGGALANMNELGQNSMGLLMFVAVIGLVLAMLAFVAIYAWSTYPSTSEIQKLMGPSQQEPLAAANLARDQWSNSVQHIAQLFIFGSLVPLLATIVGYVLGERSGKNGDD